MGVDDTALMVLDGGMGVDDTALMVLDGGMGVEDATIVLVKRGTVVIRETEGGITLDRTGVDDDIKGVVLTSSIGVLDAMTATDEVDGAAGVLGGTAIDDVLGAMKIRRKIMEPLNSTIYARDNVTFYTPAQN